MLLPNGDSFCPQGIGQVEVHLEQVFREENVFIPTKYSKFPILASNEVSFLSVLVCTAMSYGQEEGLEFLPTLPSLVLVFDLFLSECVFWFQGTRSSFLNSYQKNQQLLPRFIQLPVLCKEHRRKKYVQRGLTLSAVPCANGILDLVGGSVPCFELDAILYFPDTWTFILWHSCQVSVEKLLLVLMKHTLGQ